MMMMKKKEMNMFRKLSRKAKINLINYTKNNKNSRNKHMIINNKINRMIIIITTKRSMFHKL